MKMVWEKRFIVIIGLGSSSFLASSWFQFNSTLTIGEGGKHSEKFSCGSSNSASIVIWLLKINSFESATLVRFFPKVWSACSRSHIKCGASIAKGNFYFISQSIAAKVQQAEDSQASPLFIERLSSISCLNGRHGYYKAL